MKKICNFKNSAYPFNAVLKKDYNEKLFKEVSSKYDLITRVLSFNRDKAWKRQLIDCLPEGDYADCLDIACGTGDLSFALASRFSDAKIYGIDLTPEMIEQAKGKNVFGNVKFFIHDMCDLPYDSGSIDLITGGYALRNAPDLEKALKEFVRVLKPGGVAGFLDFSKSGSKMVQSINYFLLKSWGGLWGVMLHGNPAVYTYIAESLWFYPEREKLHGLLLEAGLEVIYKKYFFGGMIEMTLCKKIE
ncbi:MAG: hypothetical protein C5B43_04770 [Verrucomicrobia bacterium]|nr:MAG: hypothetical protein C5B43_04770 [Verrucomicrobiota bacterium]